MWAAVSIASACATASKMWVPPPSFGVDASAAEIFVFDVVSGSSVVAWRLNSITPSCSFGFRWAANAFSAARAAAMGFPLMLQLLSRTSTVPNVFFEVLLAGTSVGSATEPPFSVTLTSLGVSRRLLGSKSTYVRTGKAGPWASTNVGPLDEEPAAAAVPASRPTARTTAAMSGSRLTGLPFLRRRQRRIRAAGPGRGRAAARCRASRTSGGTSGGVPSGAGRRRSCRRA